MIASGQSLPLWKKLVYATGDFGISSAGMLRQVFYAIYLTDVVGLDPRLASFGALAGIVWDGINDPLVGLLSDHLHTRLGRRRPFLLIFAIPFGLSFAIMWVVPPLASQLGLIIYVSLAFMLADTLTTLISVPFNALMPEIDRDYDERTGLMGYRSFFQLGAALITVILAPVIVDASLRSGLTQQQGFLITSALFGSLSAVSYLVIFFVIHETADAEETGTMPIAKTLRIVWTNKPFRFALGMYLFNWSAVDMSAMILPLFLTYWVAGGNMLESVKIFGMNLSLDSAFLGLLMLTSIVFIPFWSWFAQWLNKQLAYMCGMAIWVFLQASLFIVQPGQVGLALFLGILVGIGVSSAYVLPDSIFPDVIEWDELRTGKRQEGIYYGARSLIRKLTGALTIFFALQMLGWAGYQTPPAGVTEFMQPASVTWMIRLLVSLIGALFLSGAIVMAWFYPLSRERHNKIRELLARQKGISQERL